MHVGFYSFVRIYLFIYYLVGLCGLVVHDHCGSKYCTSMHRGGTDRKTRGIFLSDVQVTKLRSLVPVLVVSLFSVELQTPVLVHILQLYSCK